MPSRRFSRDPRSRPAPLPESARDGKPGEGLRGRTAILAAILSLAVTAAYLPALRAPFYLDDFAQIVNNPVTRWDADSFVRKAARILEGGAVQGRSLALLSFGLTRWLAGERPEAFRVVNILFHIGTAVLFGVMAGILIRIRGHGEGEEPAFARWFPVLVPFFWAANPTHTQTVTYIVQRMNGGMAFFLLASLAAFFRGRLARRAGDGREGRYYLLAAVLGILSLGFKQNAVLLPFLALAGVMAFERPRTGRGRDRAILVLAPACLVVMAAAVFWGVKGGFFAADPAGLSWGRRMLTEARVIPYYGMLFLVPRPAVLHLNYDFPVSSGPLAPPTTLLGILVMVLWVAAIAWLFSRKGDPWIAFGLLWALAGILPESALPSIDLVFEHRLYLPSIGFSLVLGRIAWLAMRTRPVGRPKAAKLLPITAGAVLALLLLAGTAARNRVWADSEVFWAHETRLAPGNIKAIEGRMVDLLEKKRYDGAVVLGEAALGKRLVADDFRTILNNLAVAYAEKQDWGRMVSMMEGSIRTYGERIYEDYNLGVAYYKLGKIDLASRYLSRVLEQDGGHPDANYYLGRISEERGDRGGAAAFYGKAVKSRPDDAEALWRLEGALMAVEDWAGASRIADRLRTLPGPGQSPGHLFRAGFIYIKARRLDEAERSFRAYATVNPGDAAARFNLACVYSLGGDVSRSLASLEEALRRGYRDRSLFTDPDLDAARKDPRFGALMRSYRVAAR